MNQTSNADVEIGEHWAYRARGIDQLVEVEVLKVGTGRPARVWVRFVGEAFEGREDWVPPARLKVLWVGVEKLRAYEARWAAVCGEQPYSTDTEEDAAWTVYECVLDGELMTFNYNGGRCSTGRIHDTHRLATSLDLNPSLLTSSPLSFEENGSLVVPWSIVKLVVQTAAARNPEPLLARIDEDERELRRHLVYGESHISRIDGHEVHLKPEWYAEQDEKSSYGRVYREQIREWCGTAAADRHDELAELRKELARLAQLAGHAATALRHAGRETQARQIERALGVTVQDLRR